MPKLVKHCRYPTIITIVAILISATWLSECECAERPEASALTEIINKHLPGGGLLLHLGCRDGKLTMQLAKASRYVIHAMDPDAAGIEKAEAAARKLPIAGLVSTEASDLSRLPFVRYLASAVILDDPERLFKESKLSAAELDRILQPLGFLFVLPGASGADGAKKLLTGKKIGAGYEQLQETGLLCLRKGFPDAMDDWPQFHHDSGRTGISKDRSFGPPKSLRWVSGPTNAIGRRVSTTPEYHISHRGINIYMNGVKFTGNCKKSGPFVTSNFVFPRQHDFKRVVKGDGNFGYVLTARNAFNGVKLWRRTYYHPRETIAAADGKVYVLEDGEVKVLDIVSSKTLSSLGKAPAGALSFFLAGSRLIARSRTAFKCFDLTSEKELWSKDMGRGFKYGGQVLADEQRVYLRMNGNKVFALDAASGETVWKVDNAVAKLSGQEIRCVKDNLLFMAGGRKPNYVGIIVLSAESGKRLWDYETPFSFKVLGGLVMVNETPKRAKRGRIVALDQLTGKVKKTYDVPRFGGVCGPSISTEDYYYGDRPVRFLDMSTGKLHPFNASRPACGSGSMIANGMFYSLPMKCFCVRGSLKRYVLAASPESPYQESELKEPRLVTGPGTVQTTQPKDPKHAWPTFRGGVGRKNSVDFNIPTKFKTLWKQKLSGLATPQSNAGDDWMDFSLGLDAITSPVTDGERVFTAAIHAGTIFALDAKTGKILWTVKVDGRMEVPPTLHKGLCFAGTKKGLVYAIDGKTGEMVWRFRAAPSARMFMAYGQLESPWPVVGGVLIHQDMAFVICGRSTEIDGGVWAYGLDPLTGKTVWMKNNAGEKHKALPDIPVGAGDNVLMAGNFNVKTGAPGKNMGIPVVQGHFGGRGLIIDRSWHTAYEPMWYQGMAYGKIKGQHLACTKEFVSTYDAKWMHREPVVHKLHLYSAANASKKNPKPLWTSDRPPYTSIDAMVLAPNVLAVAERKLFDVLKVKIADRTPEDEGKLKSEILLMNTADGKVLQTLTLDGPVAADGLAVTKDRLLVSCMDGTVVCFQKQD